MLDTLRDLYAHQAWADAVHWHVLAKHPGALEDAAILTRLRHIQQVQGGFLTLIRGEPIDMSRFSEESPVDEVRRSAVQYHGTVAAWLAAATPESLAATVVVPWFADPPCSITAGQALLQAAMHSHYHRGQNATRLREMGGKPPVTDLIVWYWKGRPAPRWS